MSANCVKICWSISLTTFSSERSSFLITNVRNQTPSRSKHNASLPLQKVGSLKVVIVLTGYTQSRGQSYFDNPESSKCLLVRQHLEVTLLECLKGPFHIPCLATAEAGMPTGNLSTSRASRSIFTAYSVIFCLHDAQLLNLPIPYLITRYKKRPMWNQTLYSWPNIREVSLSVNGRYLFGLQKFLPEGFFP